MVNRLIFGVSLACGEMGFDQAGRLIPRHSQDLQITGS